MPIHTDSELALEFYETGMLAYDQLKLSLAHKNFEYAVKEDPDFFMAYFWMFFISSEGSKDIIDKALQSGITQNPGEEELRAALKYLKDGQDEKVVEHLNKLIELYPSDPHLHKILYIIQFHYFKDPEAAIVSIERATRECPAYPLAYNQLGYAYMDLERYDDAEKAFDRYIQLAPDIAYPYDSKGDFFMTIQKYQEAHDSYMKAYEIDSDFTMSLQKAEKAKMLLEKMVS
ncbi:MAG: tetratricopeptide repeat protein [Bacteroidales bacterium]|nr:tetratricopeptide repeat protein [Bacteroidales bacterium]